MELPITNYRFSENGWSWVYELFPDRLIVTGIKEGERQYFELDLKNCNPVRDRGVSEHYQMYPTRLWVAGGLIVGATILFFAAAVILRKFFDIQLPGFEEQGSFITLIGTTLCVEVIAIAAGLPMIFHDRLFQRSAVFKKLSDGTPLLSLMSALNPNDDAFENFVSEVMAAIQKQRDATASPNYSIKAER